jgi:hypothetical protein
MENFEKRLKRDAAEIRAEVSPGLDERIRASLESAIPVRPDTGRRSRPGWFWLASSLTGAAAALVLITATNLREEPAAPAPTAEIADVSGINMPALDVRPAVLGSLETELENLKGDLKKAEEVVREDIDRLLGEPTD